MFCAALIVAASLTGPNIDSAVAARQAVERVYWAHRTWPDDNPHAKAPFDRTIPDDLVRARVEEARRKTSALETLRGRPITHEMLQTELNRMAASTRAPLVLREIFDALGNDPELIVETVVLPTLTDRLLRESYGDEFDRWWKDARTQFDAVAPDSPGHFTLPTIGGDACTPMTWEPTCCADAPPPGAVWAEAVWTGAEMIVWGGANGTAVPSSGRYDPALDSWIPMTHFGEPSVRAQHTAVWTGTELIIWGGATLDGNATPIGTGGRYNPATDTWAPTSMTNAPDARFGHTAVWTGSLMVIWGGNEAPYLNTGARYDPVSDTWSPTSVSAQTPAARNGHTAIWTGSRMIVWGGVNGTTGLLDTGGLYDPAANAWSATKTQGAPGARSAHTAVWSGSEMIVWGGGLNTGGRYDPVQNTWSATSTGTGVPTPRFSNAAVWTGTRMLIWGGSSGTTLLGNGARYDPVSNSWAAMSGSGAPTERRNHVAVWTGTRMLVWGGSGDASDLQRPNTGGRYDPVSDTWLPTRTSPADPARTVHTATWTGSEMIVFGGLPNFSSPELGDPRRYDPATDTWSNLSSSNAPSARRGHSAVWTGSEVVLWGGSSSGTLLGDGARYDPATDTWTTIPAAGAPAPRSGHTAVWTGTRMIVWGGGSNTGGLYDPGAGAWSATSTGTNVPTGRSGHTAVWTGHDMIVWGGSPNLNTGGRYDPVGNTWLPTATTGAPVGRFAHTAVWTGSKMIVWGGNNGFVGTNTGAAYDPLSNGWTLVPSGPDPSARYNHAAVWTGNEMVVWGGQFSSTPLGDGARYDPALTAWTTIPAGAGSPSARRAHTATWTGTEVLIWGGDDTNLPVSTGAGLCFASCASPSFWHPDADGDGFGAEGVTVQACTQPAGHVAAGGDCNDRNAAVHPGAAEACNALDDDCDGVADEGLPSVAGSPLLLVNHSGQTALLSWSAADGVVFDIVDGSVTYMRQFGNLTFTCHQNVAFNYSGTSIADSNPGPLGHPLFYLVRGHSCSGAIGSWSSGSPSERPGRDADLAVPHGTCP